MTPRLLLNFTKPKDYARNAREERCEVCVCSNLYPPCIYSREPRGETLQTDLRDLWGGATYRSWGGGAHGPGRPTSPWCQPPAIFFLWAVLASLVWSMLVSACLERIWSGSWATLVHLSLNFCSDIICDFMSSQSILATCILAQKHSLYFLEGEVWFRDFIG